MVRVSLDGQVLAESKDTVVVEGNYYFPPSSVKKSVLSPSATSTVCSWKGNASYYDAMINGKSHKDVAWYYPATISDRAKPIENWVAFYRNKVEITA
ncbi:DUF427-domain-containing protein [Gymnopilus junonius]|uniref:DUF427-domain-containing protein n=1 Tax=Gymnopilus junonius TaxID=109634 RepID=A0A9P5NT42_GYMJU|nr:DUF427-domain-containing protein [Gymnopilus junonius]